MAFQKGQSGNPGGRPKSVEGVNLRELARSHTEKAINTLVGIMDNEQAPEPARISAANSLLDRGYGRPAQTLADENGDAVSWLEFLTVARSRMLAEQRETMQ
jgi:hypothetical protein